MPFLLSYPVNHVTTPTIYLETLSEFQTSALSPPIMTPLSVCRTLGMSVAWLQHLRCRSLVPLWLLPSLVLPGSRGGGAHLLLPRRPPLLLQSQPRQSPGLRLRLDPAAPLRSEPRQRQRGAGDGGGPAGHRVTPLLPQYLIPCKVRSCWPPGLRSTSDLKQCATKGNTVWPVRWPLFRDETHGWTPWCRLWRLECRRGKCPGIVFPPLLP